MRLLADPNKLVMFGTCSTYDLATRTFPAGCDWFDMPPRPGSVGASVNIESIAPAVQLIVVLILFGWLVRRDGGPTWIGIAASSAAAVGSMLLIGASLQAFYFLDAPGIALLGIAWLAAARLVRSRRLAVLSVVLGVVGLLEAVDNAVVMLPGPVGPVWIRVLLELTWMGWMAVVLLDGTRRSRQPRGTKAAGKSKPEPDRASLKPLTPPAPSRLP